MTINKEKELQEFHAFLEQNFKTLLCKYKEGNIFAVIEYRSMLAVWMHKAIPDTHVVVPKEPAKENIADMQDIWFKSDCAHIMKTSVAIKIYQSVTGVDNEPN